MAIGGIISGVADVGNTINSIISTYYQLEATTKAEKRARADAQVARQDVLAQNKIQNSFTQQQLDLSKQGMSWERMKWGQTWGLTKQQYLDQRNAQLADMKRTGKLDALNGMMSYANQDQQLKNQIIGRMGV